MSGGVDSSVAAWLLQQQGHHVEGLFMKNWNDDDGTEYCTAMTDLADAAHVAQTLGIRLHTANFAEEYWDRVFEHFLQEYSAGRTPNPDILCNKEIKFRAFLDHALSLGADYIATGHYTRTKTENGKTMLLKGLDANKDQSYFLHAVHSNQLSRALFPVGELDKSDVRAIALAQGLITHDKKDSTGICFIGERRFKDFLAQYIPAQPGPIISVEGEKLGQHSGLMFHTIGQRQGLGIGGIKGQPEKAWYVTGKDTSSNTLYVAQGNDHPALFAPSLHLNSVEWINEQQNIAHATAAKIRYRQADQSCRLVQTNSGYIVEFAHPQRAISPGQYCVFYDGEQCLGGGIIMSSDVPSNLDDSSSKANGEKRT